jgi:hypothetical protein
VEIKAVREGLRVLDADHSRNETRAANHATPRAGRGLLRKAGFMRDQATEAEGAGEGKRHRGLKMNVALDIEEFRSWFPGLTETVM